MHLTELAEHLNRIGIRDRDHALMPLIIDWTGYSHIWGSYMIQAIIPDEYLPLNLDIAVNSYFVHLLTKLIIEPFPFSYRFVFNIIDWFIALFYLNTMSTKSTRKCCVSLNLKTKLKMWVKQIPLKMIAVKINANSCVDLSRD